MGGRTRRRPLAAHRLLIEVDLVTAGDIDQESLVSTLTQLATAGLYKMVSEVRQVVLDGVTYQASADAELIEPSVVQEIHPPVDPKVKRALMELEEIAALLRSMGEEDEEPTPLPLRIVG